MPPNTGPVVCGLVVCEELKLAKNDDPFSEEASAPPVGEPKPLWGDFETCVPPNIDVFGVLKEKPVVEAPKVELSPNNGLFGV